MKNVSNQFKDTMNEVIRPATQLHFEIETDVLHIAHGGSYDATDIGFDTNVAPVVVAPDNCMNTNYYVVVGDHVGVGDPNRICAPDDVSETPNVSIPIGITGNTPANTEILIGDADTFYNNFSPFVYGGLLRFVGGHLPTSFRVERYDFDTEAWIEEYSTSGEASDIWEFDSLDPANAGDFRRFYISAPDGGRFQISYAQYKTAYAPVVFENSYISSVNISEETDLTSQALPSYDMTVECLDPDEIYTPDTDYWKYQFVEGSECFFKLGYEINGANEYIPMFYGRLTQAPTYGQGKITFNIATDLERAWEVQFLSVPNKLLNTGDIVDSILFKDLLDMETSLFDSYDVFHGADDERGSECNFYGDIPGNEARQLIANALGCYITAGVGTVDLHNANDIQYKDFSDYVTRYEQVQATLESQPKVRKIVVTRNENLLSSNSVQRTIAERFYVHADEYVEVAYNIPFYAVGKFVVNNYQKTAPAAAVAATYNYTGGEEIKPDGTVDVMLQFWADRNTYLQPIITFYGVDNNKYDENEYIENSTEGETYENNNDLITNGYTANKAKRVAHLINDIPNVYEVDVVQDYRYELGDVIRLETQKNIFKTCVVTGLNFTLPGSNGHITCRKIFSMLDSADVVQDAEGLTISTTDTDDSEINFTIAEANESGVIVGYTPAEAGFWADRLYILGSKRIEGDIGGVPVEEEFSGYLTDLNGHEWYFYTHNIKQGADIDTTAPVVELPSYDYTTGATVEAWGVICLLKHLYESQGMTAPVDYDCEVTPVN